MRTLKIIAIFVSSLFGVFFGGRKGGRGEDNLRPKLISFEFKDRPAKPKEKGEVNSKMKVKLQMYFQVAQDPPFI